MKVIINMEKSNIKTAPKLNIKRQFCTFNIERHFFGVDILDVKEIIDEIAITTIHHSPEEVLGFINVRGHVHLVVDLRTLLNFEQKEIDDSSRIILFTPEVGESFGVLVDQIGHMVEVSEKKIEYKNYDEQKVMKNKHKRINKLEIGACKLEEKLLIILDSKKILEVIRDNLQD